MITINNRYISLFLLMAFAMLISSCQREIDGLELATNPTDGDVFIDGFSGGLDYAAFGGSDVTAFDVDTEVKYSGTASMRIAVPDFEDPKGAYAGGVYFTGSGRDLSGYDALTFWAKASQPANIDILGIGNDLGENKYQAAILDVPVNTNWKKYYIPIPDPAKLTNERGMFFYSEGPENERGYTIWFDEVKFETLGTIGQASATIQNGENAVVQAETGDTYKVDGISIFNLPSGVNQTVFTSSAYFTFVSSNPAVATVDDQGVINVLDAGFTTITALLGEIEVKGSLTISSSGDPILPATVAPTPTENPDDVISIFSNAYIDEPVDFYNGFWEFSSTQSKIVQLDMDDIIRYSMLNFVGIQFTAPTLDISEMTHFHIDIWTPDATDLPKAFKVLLVDLGPDGTFDGGDNASHELTFTSPTLMSESWVSLDIPLSNFVGLTTKSDLAQIVLSGDLPNVFVDNMYFYDDGNTGGPTTPATAAPNPTQNSNDVISVFSDSYTNLENVNLNPDWGQTTIYSEEVIQGNNTLKLSALNYQGIELGSNQDLSDMEFLHIDYWTSNSSELNAYLISPGPLETASSLSVPTTGWASVDIALSAFTDVNLTEVFQMKFDGNGDIYLDNIYFYKTSGGGGDEPTSAAPTPTVPEANVISLFSDAYMDQPVDTWRTDWSSAVLEDVSIDGNPTKKYSQLDFVGIETTSNQIDATSMTHIHIDVWSPNATQFGIKIVDFGADGMFGGGDDVEHQRDFPMPSQGSWISYDIPLSEFTGLTTRANLAQYILVGQPTGASTVFIDNVYFHN